MSFLLCFSQLSSLHLSAGDTFPHELHPTTLHRSPHPLIGAPLRRRGVKRAIRDAAGVVTYAKRAAVVDRAGKALATLGLTHGPHDQGWIGLTSGRILL